MDLTLTLTPEEQTGLDHVTAKFNAARQAALPPEERADYVALSAADYLRARIADVLASYVDEEAEDTLAAGIAAYKSAPPERKAQIKAALGL